MKIEPLFASMTADDRAKFWAEVFAPAKATERAQVWQRALVVAKEAVDLFPPDTEASLHRFGAETVLRALMKAALEDCNQ